MLQLESATLKIIINTSLKTLELIIVVVFMNNEPIENVTVGVKLTLDVRNFKCAGVRIRLFALDRRNIATPNLILDVLVCNTQTL